MEPTTTDSERSALLNNANTEKSYTLDNVVLGGGLVAGAVITIYKAVEYATETPTWLLLTTSASLVGVTIFAIVRSRSANSERELNLERVINTAKSNASSELKQISQKTTALSMLMPQSKEEGQSIVQIQTDYSSAYVLQQLSGFEEYLTSQKASNSLASEQALALQIKNNELKTQLESAQSELLSKKNEIETLSGKNNSQLQEIEREAKAFDQLQEENSKIAEEKKQLSNQLNTLMPSIKKKEKEILQLKENLSNMQETHRTELESLTKRKGEMESEIEDLYMDIESNKLQWLVAQQTLGNLNQPLSIENADKVRQHIINHLATPSKSRDNSRYSSATNSAYGTPSKLNNNS